MRGGFVTPGVEARVLSGRAAAARSAQSWARGRYGSKQRGTHGQPPTWVDVEALEERLCQHGLHLGVRHVGEQHVLLARQPHRAVAVRLRGGHTEHGEGRMQDVFRS